MGYDGIKPVNAVMRKKMPEEEVNTQGAAASQKVNFPQNWFANMVNALNEGVSNVGNTAHDSYSG